MEEASQLIRYSDIGKWEVFVGEEGFVSGSSDCMEMPVLLEQKLSDRKYISADGRPARNKSFVYGWPVAVLSHNGSRVVCPLISVAVEATLGPDGWLVHAISEPELNRAVFASGCLDFSLEEEIKELCEGLVGGGASDVEKAAGEIVGLAGLKQMSRLGISNLEGEVDLFEGVYNCAAFFLADSWSPMQGVREELALLKERTDWRDTAAAVLVLGADKEASGMSYEPLACPLPSNEAMEQVLSDLRTKQLTMATGPPGTGKTQLVANAVANAWLDNQTVLVASTNNAAVEVAVSRTQQELGDGLLIRTGSREYREHIPDHIIAAQETAKTWRKENSIDEAEARGKLAQAAGRRQRMLKDVENLSSLDSNLLKSVQALSKVWQELWPGADVSIPALGDLTADDETAMARNASKSEKLMKAWLLRKFRQRRFLRKIGIVVAAGRNTQHLLMVYIDWVYKLRAHLRLCRRRQKMEGSVGDVKANLENLASEWQQASIAAVKAAAAREYRSKKAPTGAFSQASSSHALIKAMGKALEKKTPKGWACTTHSMPYNFPLEADLFDLAIVDEASQCSVAAVLPVAYRAKRLGVIGDPNQLRPIAPVGDKHLAKAAKQANLDNEDLKKTGIHHKEGSAYWAFEFASQPDAPTVLDEHYRCHPLIARWFNQHFYKDELIPLTEVSEMSGRDRHIFWVDADGEAQKNPNGGSWYNEAEAELAVKQTEVFAQQELSVGVLTPFAGQVALIRKKFVEFYGSDRFREMDVEIGTAHRLQGSERDAIVFSTVLSPGMNPGTARWVENERNLINVAVSRAKQVLAVIGHPQISDVPVATLRSLRAYCKETEEGEHTSEADIEARFRTDSGAEKLLLQALRDADIHPYAKLVVEGYEMDFAILEGALKLNIEVDGDHHIDQRGKQVRQDIRRDRILERLNWQVMRVPAWRCLTETDSVVAEIQERCVDMAGSEDA